MDVIRLVLSLFLFRSFAVFGVEKNVALISFLIWNKVKLLLLRAPQPRNKQLAEIH